MGKHKNSFQEVEIVKFVEENNDLAQGFFRGDRVEAENKWKELAYKLNGLGPPEKDVNGWKKVFSDWKNTIRKKLAHNKMEASATGGGPYNQQYVSQNEETIARICGIYKAVQGISSTKSFGVKFTPHETELQSLPVDEDSDPEPSVSVVNSPPNKRKREPEPSLEQNLKKFMKDETDFKAAIGKVMENLVNATNTLAKNQEEINKSLKRVYRSLEKIEEALKENNNLKKGRFDK